MPADVVRLGRDTVFEIIGSAESRGITWAWARQDLDRVTAAAARSELTGLLSGADDPDHLLVHLGAECFVDLCGLRVLLDVAARVRNASGDLVVVAPPHSVRRMITLFDLGHELPIAATARDAVLWARPGAPARRAGWTAEEQS